MTLEEMKGKTFGSPILEKSEIETKNYDLPDKPQLSDYAESIMRDNKFKTLTDTKEILYYKKGLYVERGNVLIASKCETLIPNCSKYEVNEITAIIQRRTFTERNEFNQDLTKLVLENGILDLNTRKLSKHNPDFLTTIKIPVKYDPKATCFPYITFLKECLEPKDIITVIEEASNVLTINNKNFEVSAIWIGSGSNGKTTNIKIINGVYGRKNCSHISIHDMQEKRFAIAQLDSKLINSYSDISNKELDNMGIFKQTVSGDIIQAEKKNKDPFDLESFAKHFFSANEMPKINDNSDGAFRRIYLTKWENQFLQGVNRIEDLDKKILKKCKSGIFNLFLENHKTLIHNNGFRRKQNIAQVRQIMKLESDKLREFIEVCLVKNPKGYMPKGKLYEIYVKFCETKAYDVYSQQKFSVNLPTYGLIGDVKKINNKAVRIWLGHSLNIKDDWVKSNIRGLEEFS